jgi:hypothetical protein
MLKRVPSGIARSVLTSSIFAASSFDGSGATREAVRERAAEPRDKRAGLRHTDRLTREARRHAAHRARSIEDEHHVLRAVERHAEERDVDADRRVAAATATAAAREPDGHRCRRDPDHAAAVQAERAGAGSGSQREGQRDEAKRHACSHRKTGATPRRPGSARLRVATREAAFTQ